MPRVESSGGGGISFPGLYEQMRCRERDVCGYPDPRRVFCDPDDHSAVFFCRPRGLLDALEAGKSVLVKRAAVELCLYYLAGSRQQLPWVRSVRTVQVRPADVVSPSDREIPWYGCDVDEFVEGFR